MNPTAASEAGSPEPSRLGAIELAPGYRPRHALIYLYAAFITVGLFAFVSFFQAYLLNVNLRLPPEVQGRTVAALLFANEMVALLLVAPFGALADKVGRRVVYALGLLWVAASFLLYPLVSSLLQLTLCSMFYSVGAAAIGTMLGTVLADTPAESARGKLVGVAGFCQGLGAAVLVLVLGHVPKWLHDGGMPVAQAGAVALWLAAALCVLSALIVFLGLRRGTPSTSAPALPLRRILADGLAAARGNRRLWFAYLLQFGSFGDRVVIGTFLSLRLQQAWLGQGLGMTDATHRASLPFIVAMVAGLFTALAVGLLLDRVDRLKVGVVAMGLATVAYLLGGWIEDPTRTWPMMSIAALLGVGQIAAIIAGQTLLGEEAPRDVRGAVFGVAGMFGSAAILFTLGLGGWLYDFVSQGGPFFLLAAVNLAIFLFGLWLARKAPVSRSR